jgi:hypothetical protein
VHGVARATLDADLIADLDLYHAEPFAQALEGAFYLELETIRQAIRDRSSFNLIHLTTMFKIDIFVSRRRSFDQARFARRLTQTVATDPETQAYFASAEDIILAKLEWYRSGGKVSEKQWRDILGILKIQQTRLDLAYLRRWAANLQVADLLERALQEAA